MSTVEDKHGAKPTVGESILAAGGDAVVATDHDGIIRIWNPGAERIFGYGADEAGSVSLLI
jgi:PAS domain S-box-containing protein